ncbi:MAG: CHAT domain-containing protein, partial [Planctomycetota bacterium JB042]
MAGARPRGGRRDRGRERAGAAALTGAGPATVGLGIGPAFLAAALGVTALLGAVGAAATAGEPTPEERAERRLARVESLAARLAAADADLSGTELWELAVLSNAVHRESDALPPDSLRRAELLESGLSALRRLDRGALPEAARGVDLDDAEAAFLSELVGRHLRDGRTEAAKARLAGYERLAGRAPRSGPWLHVRALELEAHGFPAPTEETLDAVTARLEEGDGRPVQIACVLAGLRVERRIAYGTPDLAARMHAVERRTFERLKEVFRPERAPVVARHAVEVALAGGSHAQAAHLAGRALVDPEVAAGGPRAIAPLELRRIQARWMSEQDDEGAADRAERALAALDEGALPGGDRWSAWIWRARARQESGRPEAAREALERAEALAGDDPLARARTAAAVAWLRRQGGGREPAGALEARLREGCDALLDAWRHAPTFEGGVGFLYYSMRRSVPSEAIHLLAERGEGAYEEEALGLLLRAHASGSLARALALDVVPLEAVRRDLLADGEGLLVHLPAKGGSHVFAVDRDVVLHATTADEEVLRRAVVRLQEEVSRPPPATDGARLDAARARAHDAGRALGRLLLPARIAARVASWEGVVVTGHDWLGWVPFECVAPADGEPLGRTHAVRSIPTISLGHHLAVRPRATSRFEVALLAAPARDDVPALPFDRAGAARLLLPFDEERRSARLGRAATRRALAESDARVVTVLAHGGYERRRIRPASLLLTPDDGDDGRFTSGDAERRGRPAEVVVLAACGAARGPSRVGDDGVSNLGE